MIKKVLKLLIVIFVSLFNFTNLNALEIDGEKYHIEIINDYYEDEFYKDGARFINNFNKEISDLENGKINIDVNYVNYVDNEIIYVIDGYNKLNYVKNRIKSLDTNNFVKQGVVITTNNDEYYTIGLSDSIVDKIDNIGNIPLGKEGDIFNAIEYATTLFSSNTNSKKTLVVLVNSLGNTDENILKNKINNILKNKINIFVARANDSIDINKYNNIFENVNSNDSEYNDSDSYDRSLSFIVYPCEKEIFDLIIKFNDIISNNFDIKVKESNNYLYKFNDNEESTILKVDITGSGSIGNEKILTYTLSLKDNFDKNLIGKELTITEPISLSAILNNHCRLINDFDENGISLYASGYDHSFYINSTLSFKIVKDDKPIINEPIDNPKTGIESYVVFGICLMIVSGVTYIIITKRKVL